MQMQISLKSGERGKTTWEKPSSKKRDMYKSEKEREEDLRREKSTPPEERREKLRNSSLYNIPHPQEIS